MASRAPEAPPLEIQFISPRLPLLSKPFWEPGAANNVSENVS